MVLFVALCSLTAQAVDPVYTPVFSNKAIKGYDTVAYFAQGKAVKGSDQFSTEYQGATWLFASQAHLGLFLANPEKYTPQYGGYCAYAVAKNSTASVDPELFYIEDGRLFLNYNRAINDKWLENRLSFIEAADKNWPDLVKR